ncbi:MAG: hypothetical protein HQL50_11880 [Magnetococcales bacterium]|nr:hypothetical protein [Magnetococcales bacterium]
MENASAKVANRLRPVATFTESEPLNPIPPDHKYQLLDALNQFRREHGRQLKTLGWNRDSLFHGVVPEEVNSYDDMPGLVVLLAKGAALVRAERAFLIIETGGGERLLWVHPGFWLGGDAATDWMEGYEERAAIREHDGGQSRQEAEQSAMEDVRCRK